MIKRIQHGIPSLAAAVSLTVSLALPAVADIDEVRITASRIAEPAAGQANNQATLGGDALALTAAVHIQEALSRLPGIDMHRNNGQEYLPAIRSPVLSGPGACGSFLMAEDGIALRPAGFCNVNELFEAHSESASRIEVIRGPGNALFGSNAQHGVINVIAPADFESPPRLGLETGPNDFQRLRVGAGDDTWALSFTGSHDGGYRDDSGVDQQKLSLRYRYPAQGYQLTAGLTAINLNQETAGFLDGDDAYKDDSRVESNDNPEAFRDARAVRVWARFEQEGAQPRWVITPYARYSEMDFLQHFLPGTPLEQNGQHSAGLQSATYWYGEHSRLIAGLDLEVTRGWLEQSQDAPTPDSAFLTETIPVGKHYDYTVDAYQVAPFVQWRYSPSRHWTLTAGVRFETMVYDYDNRMVDGRTRDDGTPCGFGGCRYTRPSDREDSFDNWSPNLGVLYRFNDQHQFFANLARGFRAPQAVELYRLQREQRVADLDSEVLDSLEIGLRGGSDRLRYELTAYAMVKDNVIFRDSDFFNVSDGKTTHQGVELATSYRFSEHWDVSLSGTVARHRYDYREVLGGIDIDGNEVDTAPHHFGSAALGWQPVDNSRMELQWLRVGGYYTDPENLHRYPGHDVVNIRGFWQVTGQWRLSARLLNVLDTEYAERADYTSFSGERYFPGEPRSLYVGVEYEW
ncbi:MAG: TonB-dependent receptor [Porticoccaceae bacterium]|nr:TonB-dependent receptor [Porticoccaceae bacterium]